MSVLKVHYLDPRISKYFLSLFEETVNYREWKNITRNDFMQLLIQIKNKVKLHEDNEGFEEKGHGTLGNISSEEGRYTVSSFT
jgi:cytochrome P450 family 6